MKDLARLPFLRLKIQGIGLDVGTLATSHATYVNITATEMAMDDLRLAYSKIMTEYEVTDDEGSDDPEEGQGQGSMPVPARSNFDAAQQPSPSPAPARPAGPPAGGASLFDRWASFKYICQLPHLSL